MRIRPATPADIPAMRAIEVLSSTSAHWTTEAYKNIFSGDPPRVALVYEDQQVVGFVVGSQNGPEWEIENIVVAEQSRKQGIGVLLVAGILDLARQSFADGVVLEVRESNTSARRLYQRQGFQEVGRRREYYQNPAEDAVLYRIKLLE